MKVLITGGSGFIGSHLVDTYLEGGHEVGIIDRVLSDSLNPKARFFHQDITKDGLEEIFIKFKPDVVNHHAALINVAQSFQIPTEYTQTNVLGTIRLLELSKKYSVKQFLFASSVAVYGWVEQLPITETVSPQPDSFYGIDKFLGEWYVQLYSKLLITTIFRYANVYGPRQNTGAEGGAVAIFANQINNGKPVVINGTGEQTRDFVYVKDVARASLLATQQNLGGVFQIATDTETSVNALFDTMVRCANLSIAPVHGPARIGDVERIKMSFEVFAKASGWNPQYTLTQGLTETLNYFRQ